MLIKAPSTHGVIVDADGAILQVWWWNHTAECPHEFEVPDGGQIISCTEKDVGEFRNHLHLCKFNKLTNCIINKETGELICQIKSPGVGHGSGEPA